MPTNTSRFTVSNRQTARLSPPHFIEMPVPGHECERPCTCVVRGIDPIFLHDFLLYFRTVSAVRYCLSFN